MDGLTLWKSILNAYKEDSNSSHFFNTFFNDKAVKYYDYEDDTIFLLCEGDFVRENVDRQIENIYKIAKEKLMLDGFKIKTITSGSEVQKIFKNVQQQKSDNIIDKYTFDSFVTGSSNKLAYAACVSVAEMPAFESPKNAYNPLFLYGGVGLGKTHLMHAIANRIKEKNSEYKISYVSSETFTNELITSIQEKKNKEFREKYRSLDVILIDDIQFIAGKESTQEEFFHTFNELHSSNKQIIISSDRPPKEIATLEDRLRSRFEMGLTVDIQAPDFETRVAILKKKCEIDQRVVSDDVLVLIAKNIKSNIRELEGSLNKVCAYSNLMSRPITYDLAMDALKDILSKKDKKELNSDYIKEVVAKEFNIKIDDFSAKSRDKLRAYPRQIAMYLCRELTDMSLPKIGDEFGGRDHTTVMHACNKIKDDIDNKKDGIDTRIEKIIEQLRQEWIKRGKFPFLFIHNKAV